MTEYKIFPTELVIDSMKDSGYKDAAHAVAELIDNSIQAGENVNKGVERRGYGTEIPHRCRYS